MKTKNGNENLKAGVISMAIILLACAATFTACSLVCCKPANADVSGSATLQFTNPNTKNSIQAMISFNYKSDQIPRIGVFSFATIKNGWAEVYAGPTFWVVPKHLRLGIHAGFSQAADGPLARMAFTTLALYNDFGFAGTVEWNIVSLSRMESKTWYVMRLWHKPASWFRYGLYDKRSFGFGPFLGFIAPLGENVKWMFDFHWGLMPAEEAKFTPDNLLFSTSFCF
jgi:hypothetical protein